MRSSSRVQTHLQPESDGGCEGNACEEVGGELVVAGGDAAEVLKPAEGVLDEVTSPVALLVIADGAFAVPPAWNDGNGTRLPQRASQMIGIITFVGAQIAHASGAFEKRGRGLDVADVAGGERQCVRAADDVSERVDLRGPAAARTTDRLRRAPPFAPNAARCALT